MFLCFLIESCWRGFIDVKLDRHSAHHRWCHAENYRESMHCLSMRRNDLILAHLNRATMSAMIQMMHEHDILRLDVVVVVYYRAMTLPNHLNTATNYRRLVASLLKQYPSHWNWFSVYSLAAQNTNWISWMIRCHVLPIPIRWDLPTDLVRICCLFGRMINLRFGEFKCLNLSIWCWEENQTKLTTKFSIVRGS